MNEDSNFYRNYRNLKVSLYIFIIFVVSRIMQLKILLNIDKGILIKMYYL